MGQKINPISYRLQINKKWKSLWYKPKADFKDSLIQDIKIRELVNTKVGEQASIEKIIIKRNARDVKIEIHSSRPGILIGRQGQGIKDLKKFLINKLAMPGQKSKLDIDVMEIKNPDSVAQLVAQNIGYQLTKRIYYKRAVKHAMTKVMQSGVTGVKIQISGRLGGAEISRSEKYMMVRFQLPPYALILILRFIIVKQLTVPSELKFGFIKNNIRYTNFKIK